MKKTLFLTTLLASSLSFAQSADEMKKMALDACEAQAAAIPEAQRAAVVNMCECTAENTDYEVMLKAQSNDQEAMKLAQENAMKIAQKCAAEAS